MNLEKLEEYIYEEYDLEFSDSEENSVEEIIQQGAECLMDMNYADSWDSIKESRAKLEKYIGTGYKVKYAINSCWNQGFIVFNRNYKFYSNNLGGYRMLAGRELIDNLKKIDFGMLCELAETMEIIIEKDGADTLSDEMVKFDIGLHIALKERIDELIDCEKKVKELIFNS